MRCEDACGPGVDCDREPAGDAARKAHGGAETGMRKNRLRAFLNRRAIQREHDPEDVSYGLVQIAGEVLKHAEGSERTR